MMKVLIRTALLLVVLSNLESTVVAQQKLSTTITGNFDSITFKQLVPMLETQTQIKFYYDSTEVDSMKIHVSTHERTINSILTKVLSKTDFHYFLDSQNNLYITKDDEIQPALPANYFGTNSTLGVAPSEKIIQNYVDAEKIESEVDLKQDKLYSIGKRTMKIGPGDATIAGHISAATSGEPIIGATVVTEKSNVGVISDAFGYYALTLPKGTHELTIKSIGMKNASRKVTIYSSGQLDIEMLETVTTLREVTVQSERDKNVSGMQMGLERLTIQTMKKVPVVLGEVDIMKVLLTLPGVQSVGEATNGLNVRGGATNQNLVLFNDATIYNPSHLFGFFSAFNPDVIKSVELYKSGIPAEYGGRLSSVLDVTTREGNKKKFTGSGGVGPLTGRLTLEGPIRGEKSSFLIGARTTYSDWLLHQIPNTAISNSQAGFFDVNANLNHEFDSKNTVYFTGYLSQDHFKLNGDTLYSYRNRNLTGKWKHIFGNKFYGVLTTAYSGYDYAVSSNSNPVDAFTMKYSINQLQIKSDFSYFPSTAHALNFGVSSIRYSLLPGSRQPNGPESINLPLNLQGEQAFESALYASDHFNVSPKLSLYAGLRYSFYNYLGPRQVYQYTSGQPKSVNSIIDTVNYKSGESIVNYQGPEYRLSMTYLLSENSSIKFSYNRTRQYLQMLTNTAAISPTDVWKLSDPNIKPQIGDQIAIGYYKNISNNAIELSVEGYYKVMQNSLDYKSGAVLILNQHIETDILNAHGKAYGIEFLLKKMRGKVQTDG